MEKSSFSGVAGMQLQNRIVVTSRRVFERHSGLRNKYRVLTAPGT